MSGVVDYSPGDIVRRKINSRNGVPLFTWASAAIAVYKDDDNTEVTTGTGIIIDKDGRTGFHGITIDTAADAAFYSPGSIFTVIATAGTVDSIPVSNNKLFEFTIGFNAIARGQIDEGVAAAPMTANTLTLPSDRAYDNNVLPGATILFWGATPAYKQSRVIDSNALSGDVLTFSPPITVIPSGVTRFKIYGTPPASTTNLPDVNLKSILGTVLTETVPGYLTAAFRKFFNVTAPTGTINSLPDAIPAAAGGLPTMVQHGLTTTALTDLASQVEIVMASMQNAEITLNSNLLTGEINIWKPGTSRVIGNFLGTIPISRPSTAEPFSMNKTS